MGRINPLNKIKADPQYITLAWFWQAFSAVFRHIDGNGHLNHRQCKAAQYPHPARFDQARKQAGARCDQIVAVPLQQGLVIRHKLRAKSHQLQRKPRFSGS